MDPKQVEMWVREYVARERPGAAPFGPDTDLFEVGILDSLSLMGLIAHLEDRLGKPLGLESLVYDNFRSLSALQQCLAP